MIRIRVFWGLYWGALIVRNYHVYSQKLQCEGDNFNAIAVSNH